MGYKCFQEILDIIHQQASKKFTISVASACDGEVLETVKYADEIGLASAILVGDKKELEKMAGERNIHLDRFQVIDEPDPIKASMEAVRQIRAGNANCLMKGMVNTSDFMRAVLDKIEGLRTGRVLSHLASFEVPGFERLIFITDGGLNIHPSLEEKKEILQNAVDYLIRIGYQMPKVAVLSANEAVNPKQPVTMEAAALKQMAEHGEITGALVDGPMSLDLALDQEAAVHKKIVSPVAGQADLFLVPTIEVGNILGKSLIYCGKAVMAGIILGAQVPIILTSRAATMEMKIASLALAALPGTQSTKASFKPQ
ncbi:bifunctional enoyl-CoA hydratase/phosphate acetyltransferase [Candidatus Formimonas warabiya]|uniref:Phosphate butyryltransferase n=1 Tax=Formimonas warabiya TaxID=1761012 RepID=A0A3G1KZM6_FORW1|nr:bifunctional enoyl-CoA hydratase/phosphate acetyltransferase [Candidatus Formimonas warabiya]ATW27996.1 phosphate butyryltransferase [Candidatus Formimonas warabiya]